MPARGRTYMEIATLLFWEGAVSLRSIPPQPKPVPYHIQRGVTGGCFQGDAAPLQTRLHSRQDVPPGTQPVRH